MNSLPFRMVTQSKITVSLAEKRLYFYQGPSLLASFPIAVGKSKTPTPTGGFSVFEKIINPGGVFGSRWLGFYQEIGKKWGIHGTNNPASIGNEVSLGCIRMFNPDIESIFPLVSVGTPVEITYAAYGSYGLTNPYSIQPGSNIPTTVPNPVSGSSTYIVKKGDSLWSIAQARGIALSEIIALNNITNPHLLQPGQVLRLP